MVSKPIRSRKKIMKNQFARRYAIRAAIARKAAANDNVVIGGRTIPVTDDNRQLVEFIRDIDAERAYEDAAYARQARPRIAA
jgi:ribosomal protein L4